MNLRVTDPERPTRSVNVPAARYVGVYDLLVCVFNLGHVTIEVYYSSAEKSTVDTSADNDSITAPRPSESSGPHRTNHDETSR